MRRPQQRDGDARRASTAPPLPPALEEAPPAEREETSEADPRSAAPLCRATGSAEPCEATPAAAEPLAFAFSLSLSPLEELRFDFELRVSSSSSSASASIEKR